MIWNQSSTALTGDEQHRDDDNRPSIIAGWNFLRFEESKDVNSLPICVSATSDGPMIFYHPYTCPRSVVEDPCNAMLWLPMAINHIASASLYVSTRALDDIGEFTSESWQDFRKFVSRSMRMSWSEIVRAARLDGVSVIAESITSSLFIEDGLQFALARRATGPAFLQVIQND